MKNNIGEYRPPQWYCNLIKLVYCRANSCALALKAFRVSRSFTYARANMFPSLVWFFFFVPWHENRNEIFSWSVATSKNCVWHFAVTSSKESVVFRDSLCQQILPHKFVILCSWPWAVQLPRCHAHSSHLSLLQMSWWSFITSVTSTKKQKVLSVLLSCCFISPWLKKRRCAHHLQGTTSNEWPVSHVSR